MFAPYLSLFARVCSHRIYVCSGSPIINGKFGITWKWFGCRYADLAFNICIVYTIIHIYFFSNLRRFVFYSLRYCENCENWKQIWFKHELNRSRHILDEQIIEFMCDAKIRTNKHTFHTNVHDIRADVFRVYQIANTTYVYRASNLFIVTSTAQCVC